MAANRSTANPRSRALAREREIYERLVGGLGYPEPSSLAYDLRSAAPRRLSPRDILPVWQEAAGAGDSDSAAWNMYVHVPFCKSICTFCNYRRLRVSSRDGLDEYVDFVAAEAKLFGPALEGARFGALYVGGGTPSVLSASQLDRLLGALHEHFAFRDGAQKNFEYDPMVMTEERFEVIRRYGFTRYSFGIQSSDAAVNEKHERGRQGPTHIANQFELLERFDATAVNVDFLLGLHGTTPQQMLDEIEDVLEQHRPDEVAIYYVFPTAEYLARHFEGDHERFQAFLRPFEEQLPAGLNELCGRLDFVVREAGKHVILLHNRRPRSHRGLDTAAYGYCDVPSQAHRPLQLLGFGDSARSRIFGRLLYRAEHDHDLQDPAAPRYVGVPTTVEDEIFDYVALVFRDGDRLSRELFQRTFGHDVTTVYRGALTKLVELGVAEVEPNAIVLQPQGRNERLRDLMFFFPKARRRQLAALGDWTPPTVATTSGAPEGPRLRRDVLRSTVPLEPGTALDGGFVVSSVWPPGVVLRREEPACQILVKLLQPAGAHPACRRSERFDLQYEVQEGHPEAEDLDRALDALTAVVRENESEI